MKTYSNEYIDYWGEVFVANQPYTRFMRFEAFLEAPMENLMAAIYRKPLDECDEHCLLLHKQRVVKSQLECKEASAMIEAAMNADIGKKTRPVVMRGKGLFLPFKHFVFPKQYKSGGRFKSSAN